jgi:hypothetical protein
MKGVAGLVVEGPSPYSWHRTWAVAREDLQSAERRARIAGKNVLEEERENMRLADSGSPSQTWVGVVARFNRSQPH